MFEGQQPVNSVEDLEILLGKKRLGEQTTVGEFLTAALEWVGGGGNVGGCEITYSGVPVEIVVRRKGFVETQSLENMAKDRVYTLDGLYKALSIEEIQQIDGVPAAYMEVVVETQVPKQNTFDGVNTEIERQLNRWYYCTLKFGSHLPDPVAKVEMLTQLFKLIKNSAVGLKGTAQPLLVWRVRPQFTSDTDQGVTYMRCRLVMRGVSLPSTEQGVIWCEGV
jgi:hypothetical protein